MKKKKIIISHNRRMKKKNENHHFRWSENDKKMEKGWKAKRKKWKKILGPDSVCGCKILIILFFCVPEGDAPRHAVHLEAGSCGLVASTLQPSTRRCNATSRCHPPPAVVLLQEWGLVNHVQLHFIHELVAEHSSWDSVGEPILLCSLVQPRAHPPCCARSHREAQSRLPRREACCELPLFWCRVDLQQPTFITSLLFPCPWQCESFWAPSIQMDQTPISRCRRFRCRLFSGRSFQSPMSTTSRLLILCGRARRTGWLSTKSFIHFFSSSNFNCLLFPSPRSTPGLELVVAVDTPFDF